MKKKGDTSKYNPFGLPCKQHLIPRASLKRFAVNNRLMVFNCSTRKESTLSPKDELFFIKRLWDATSEAGHMKDIEDDFQKLCDQVIEDPNYRLSNNEQKVICKMYVLWDRRMYHAEKGSVFADDVTCMTGIAGDDLEPLEKEQAEQVGLAYIDKDGEMPSRFLVGSQILLSLNNCSCKGVEWGIARSSRSRFIFPSHPSRYILPINPEVCFIPQPVYAEIQEDQVESPLIY